MRGQFTRRSILGAAAMAGVGTAGLAGSSTATADEDALAVLDAGLADDDDWLEREFRNYAKTQEAPAEQSSDPAFAERWQRRSSANGADYAARVADEPGWRSHPNACATWGQQCTGDPALYRDVDARDFYGTVGERRRVAFHDRDGARLSGHVWTPVADDAPGDGGSSGRDEHPGVVVTNGSVQASEPLYWWAAQSLVAAGYVVLTYDPRGQGRSDAAAPDGNAGGNVDGEVFVSNQVDAVDFLRSTPADPYEPNLAFDRGDGAPVVEYNPAADRVDGDRIGLAGHSAGAIGASVVQGLDPWPTGGDNPVGAIVAWDNLGEADDVFGDRWQGGGDASTLLESVPDAPVEPRVPAMGQAGDYFLTPVPHEQPPDPDGKAGGFRRWREADVPAAQFVVRGGTHYEWSRAPTFPATSWGFGNAAADHYTVAWFDRWLKEPDEDGYHDAVDRLLADEALSERFSRRYSSKRAFPDRRGRWHECGDVVDGCD